MLADTGTLGAYVDGHKVEVPETAQIATPCHCDIEGGSDLDAAGAAGAGNRSLCIFRGGSAISHGGERRRFLKRDGEKRGLDV